MQEKVFISLTESELRELISHEVRSTISALFNVKEGRIKGQYEIEDEIMNTTQAAKFLKISRMTLHRRMTEGSVPYRRLGRRIIFSKNRLKEWVRGVENG